MEQINDQVVLDRIKNGDERQMKVLYERHQKEFISWIKNRYACSEDQAKEYYQLAVVTFYENVRSGKINNLNCSIKTYLFAIGRNQALEQLRRDERKVRDVDERIMDLSSRDTEERGELEHNLELVEHCLEVLGEPGRTILELYYYHGMSMEQIAARLKYKNADTAKNLKYKSLMRLRKMFYDQLDLFRSATR